MKQDIAKERVAHILNHATLMHLDTIMEIIKLQPLQPAPKPGLKQDIVKDKVVRILIQEQSMQKDIHHLNHMFQTEQTTGKPAKLAKQNLQKPKQNTPMATTTFVQYVKNLSHLK